MGYSFYDSLESAITDIYGSSSVIKSSRTVSGGDINEAYAVTISTGDMCFLKKNRGRERSFFEAEAVGLAALAKTGAVSVPEVYAVGTDGGSAFLLMSYINSGSRRNDYWEVFGRELAMMHRAETESDTAQPKYGFISDNYIGATPQLNDGRASFVEFFRDCRLSPQFERASGYFSQSEVRRINEFMDHLDRYYIEPENPALLHGDLWGGNVITGDDGRAWLIDPAVYVGHPEADLAMTELFGRFPEAFYKSYQEVNPLQPGYAERREYYNLYHLLNHLNLFGASYLSSVRRILSK